MRPTRITVLVSLACAAAACGIDAVGALQGIAADASPPNAGGGDKDAPSNDEDASAEDASGDEDVVVTTDASDGAILEAAPDVAPLIPPYLILTHAPAPATFDLTAEGTTEFAHWGYNNDGNSVRKANTTNIISALSLVGGSISQGTGLGVTLTWMNGDPVASGSSDWFDYVTPSTMNYTSVRVPSGPTKQTLIAIVGGVNMRGKLSASLQDGSVATKTDNTYVNMNGSFAVKYVVEFATVLTSQLEVRWEPDVAGASGVQIRFAAAALR